MEKYFMYTDLLSLMGIMKRRTSNIHALIVSLSICFVLLEVSLVVWKFLVDQQYLVPFFLLFFMFVTVGLVGYIVYASLKVQKGAEALAKTLAKDMLVYSHELFSELYRSSPVPYLLVDSEGVIESTNYATARLFNVKEGDLVKQNIFDFISAKDQNKTALIPEYYRQGRFINDLEVQINYKDGPAKWVMLSLFSFHDAQGVQKGLLTLVDITKQKMVDRAKTEFVSLASHQLRTPISAMKWNVELLEAARGQGFNPAQAAYIRKIVHGLERMDALVGDFLSASKLELGTLQPDLTAIDLVPFLKSIRDEHIPMSKQRKVRLKTDWDNATCVITSDTHLLHMVLSNIISNAIKYTKEDGVVTIAAIQDPVKVTITVADTGIGIPEEDQKMIFSKMYRASNARTLVTDGTGLGLYIVKEIVRILGGNIEFSSKVDVGTTFTITLRK